MNKLKTEKGYLAGLILFTILPVSVSSFTLLFFKDYETYIEGSPFLFFSVSTITMAVALTPSTYIAALSGYFYSWAGLGGLILAYTIASILGLLIGKSIKPDSIKKTINDLFKKPNLVENLEKRQFEFIVLSRLSPIMPFAMLNLALSIYNIKWSKYIIGSIVGMLPRSLLFFWLGMNAQNIWDFIAEPTMEKGYKLLPIILIVISSLGIIYLVKRSLGSKE
ncbi:MAG: VTT domain-containing protein [Bacteroidia bacterium]|nr:VTT domain-containing protein [Bacteroidia bacterium]